MTWINVLNIVQESIKKDIELGSSDESIKEKWKLVIDQSINIGREEMNKKHE